ncbi:MAG: histidine phosphatase family protein [Candidatus Nitrosocosmicus sp.]|uniref:histidine phosphatase family protein n=2 Tax=Candidatus Nitrosocosmicus agrestis TaxID=2563600 RepID=UPI00122E38A9|nr:histidine phosphatase family protein [Candidatus Nitrosocosmicus sp. SS]KAA2283071.1 histidine phosphatase family protein [Candidatus Nitrosocosmicus sp. SS]KAF0868529.1 histidine phosphatase family protein [Candidatus Nitrosocosmicus sp. SS]MDR4490081.1 histidine phosphatase family protein [Candidatus Nitrosocosmicus sp.]
MSLLIFMRHGQAYNNVKRLLVGRNLESHLTEVGREQVTQSSELLKSIPIHKIYSSPVIRTVETAEIASKTLDLPFEIDERLFEIELGKLVGLYYDDVISAHGDLFAKFYSDNEEENSLLEFEVESFGSVRQRIRHLINEMIRKHENENILFISHLDPIKAAISLAMNIKPSSVYSVQVPNASINVLKNYDNKLSLCGMNILNMKRYLSEF